MARITVEDCIDMVPNRYELVVLAAQRAKDISAGAPPTISRDNDKDSVVALREIAERSISLDNIKQEVIQSFSAVQAFDIIDRRHPIARDEVVADSDEDQDEEQIKVNAAQIARSGMSFVDENIEVED